MPRLIRHLRFLWPPALALGILVAAAAAILAFRTEADRNRQAETRLAQIEAAAHALSAVGWQAVAERNVSRAALLHAAQARADAERSLERLADLYDPAVAGEVGGAFRQYARLVDAQLEERASVQRTGPTFAALDAQIAEASARLSQRVAMNQRRARIASVLVLAVAMAACILLMQRFVGERRRSAERTAQDDEERRRRALAEHSSDVVAVLDGQRRIRSLDGPVRRVVGRDASELLGRLALEHVHPDDRRRAGELVSVPPGTVDSGDVRITPDDGSSWNVVEVIARDRSDDPLLGGVVLSLHDVTDRRKLETQLQQAQRLEAVGRLAGGIAHDFNNILLAVRGSAELLAGGDPALASGAELRAILDATRHGAALTQQLLAFSRQQALRPKVIDPRDVVTRVEPMLRRLIREDVELVTRARDDVGHVRADPVQLEQVLLNLVVNAGEALPGGGTIVVEVRPASPARRLTEPAGHVVLSVSDTGIGMDAATAAHIFDPFFTTKGLDGTGLGLATVHGIVEQSGGRIGVESTPGAGTTISVYLPLVHEPLDEETLENAAPVDRRSDGRTVLFAEDEPRVRALVSRMLEDAGYVVLVAGDGAEALDAAAQHGGTIDLLVTDAVMPGMGGRELAERLAATRPDVKVLFISGYTEDASITTGAFLQKPFTHADLLRTVAALLA